MDYGSQQFRPASERLLSAEQLAALDLQRGKEAMHMNTARDIVEAMSQLMGAHLALTHGAPMEILDKAKRDAAYLLARALAR